MISITHIDIYAIISTVFQKYYLVCGLPSDPPLSVNWGGEERKGKRTAISEIK